MVYKPRRARKPVPAGRVHSLGPAFRCHRGRTERHRDLVRVPKCRVQRVYLHRDCHWAPAPSAAVTRAKNPRPESTRSAIAQSNESGMPSPAAGRVDLSLSQLAAAAAAHAASTQQSQRESSARVSRKFSCRGRRSFLPAFL